jgi:hypothetical protein
MRFHLAVLLPLFASAAIAADPALTVYNQQFAVVRETIPLDLKPGLNQIQFTGTTAQLEPESVMLRDPSGQRLLRILEQNYRADPVSLEALMHRYEGQTIDFEVRNGDRVETVSGKIVRAESVAPEWTSRPSLYPPPQPGVAQPIVEVAGKLRFGLPGTPLFPGLGAGMILQPTLDWTIETDRAGPVNAELAYVTGGFNWNADYNFVQGEANALDIIGWVTLENSSGKEFENARVKLMAGDVNKLQPQNGPIMARFGGSAGLTMAEISGPQVVEKTFDEYHLYTLQRPVTIHGSESKQVEFVRANNVKAEVIYVYDGAKIDSSRYQNWQAEAIRQDANYGTLSNRKVWVMREFLNSDANHLGMPLPKGRIRFYRRDTDGRLEFTGEDAIDHTAKDEKIRVFTGSAFDLTGERRRTIFHNDMGRQMMDEAFEIKVRNHKKEPAEIRVVEHLYRWSTWDITTSSMPFTKTDAQTIEFRVPLQPDEEKTVTYIAHYTW